MENLPLLILVLLFGLTIVWILQGGNLTLYGGGDENWSPLNTGDQYKDGHLTYEIIHRQEAENFGVGYYKIRKRDIDSGHESNDIYWPDGTILCHNIDDE